MKKIFTLVLAMLMVLSMVACGADTTNTPSVSDNSQSAGENNSTPTDNSTTNSSEKEEMKYPLPELKADGTYSVDFSADQIIYDKNDIKVTYKEIQVDYFGYALSVVIENNKEDNLHFMPCAAVINGVSMSVWFEIDNELIAKGETVEGTLWVSYENPVEEYTYDVASIKCFDLYFGFYSGGNMYGDVQTVIDNNVHYSFTKGEHDHRNDVRNILGELVYENDEIAIYLDKNFEEIPDKYYSCMTIVNKTNRTIRLDGLVECRYTTAPARAHYTVLNCAADYIAPNSYVSNKVYINEEHSSLDMNELVFKKQCYYATHVDDCVAPEQDTIGDDGILAFEKMNCFYDKINVNISVNKK